MEILVVLGIIGGIWFYFSVLRHSNVRLDATDLAKSFLRAYQHIDDDNLLSHYETALRAVLNAEYPQDLLIVESFVRMAFLSALLPTFRIVVSSTITLILSHRYRRPLTEGELRVISEAVVAEIPYDS